MNRLVVGLGQLPAYIGVLNADLSWESGTFEQLLTWLQQHPQVSLAVQILDGQGILEAVQTPPHGAGTVQPTLPSQWAQAGWRSATRWYVMADQNYEGVFERPTNGCC